MEVLTLTKHSSGRQVYRNFHLVPQKLSEEYKSDILSINGIYFEEIKDVFIAVFSNEEKNYMYLEKKLIELTQDISIKYFCGERNEESWLKIFNKEIVIFELEYINPAKEPFIDFFLEFEDWEVVNFAYHLAGYINKVKENPSVVLFPNEYKSPT